jgi:secreted trypsin-like serine protease
LIEAQKVQQQLAVPITTTEKCSSVYGDAVSITEDKLCAGGEKGKDACSGFAGAPLVFLPHGSDRYYQVT